MWLYGTKASWQQSLHPLLSCKEGNSFCMRPRTWLCIGKQSKRKYRPRLCWELPPKGRYNHSDRRIPEGRGGSCLPSARTTNMLRFKGTYWDSTELEQYRRETLGVVWAKEIPLLHLQKTLHPHKGHKPYESTSKKTLAHCPLRLQRYDVPEKYVMGSAVSIADALSRGTPQPCTKADRSH